ncbi:MAG: CotH kinase family protein [Oscillospiraceae bacterium]|nr:CotH kinase family protein [Oscillospiraceae bacterium]
MKKAGLLTIAVICALVLCRCSAPKQAEPEQAAKVFDGAVFAFDSKTPKTEDAGLIETLSINGAKCAYDEKSKTFYFPLGTDPDRIFEFDYAARTGSGTPVFAEIIGKDGEICPYRFLPAKGEPYILRAYSDEYTFDYKIVFTGLPIVLVSGINRIGDNYKDCLISLVDPDFAFSPYGASLLHYESLARIHVRGSSARGHPKKAYAINFVDENKKDRDTSFFGIDRDSHWILDSMYLDISRARNRVSTDLWLSFSCPLYYEDLTPKPVYNGTQGAFVEVFVNDEYMGLYCLTTKINRQQLQIKKYDAENNTIHGISYKGKGWDEPLRFKSYYAYSNDSEWWASFQQKYPNPRNALPIDWKPLYDLVKFVVDSDDETFKREIGQMIDIDNFVDYTIFLCFSLASDNTGKNAYWSVYDLQDPEMSKFFITVWDLKSTWGRTWNPDPTSPDREWMDSDPEHDTALFRRLVQTNACGFADKMRSRWEEVKTAAFSPDAVKALFIQYFDLFEASGAFEREAEKWDIVKNGYADGKLALAAEREYILNWIEARYEYIDDFITNKLGTVGDFAPARSGRRR